MGRSLIFAFLCSAIVLLGISGWASADPPRVNVMPDGIYKEGILNTAYAWPGANIVIWGNVKDGVAPYTYSWDFGDGSPVVSGAVADPKYIAVSHAYTTMGPKYATLTVTDNDGDSDSDVVRIDVVALDLDIEVSLAIEEGLRYLYLNQASDGYWTNSGSYHTGVTGLAVLAFENRGHRPGNDVDEDIYAETVQKGLAYILNHGYTQAIGPQAYCDPDVDGDGIGIKFVTSAEGYETGICMMALVASGAPGRAASSTSSSDIDGHTYLEIMRDAVDWCAWAQNESGSGRGGWRYNANYGDSDNSVSQWPTIGLEAAETHWGVAAPQCTKDELIHWITYGQAGNGGFCYNSSNYWLNVAKTGAGVCELSYVDIPTTDSRVVAALGFINSNWYSTSGDYANFGDYYAMYAVAKGCRVTIPEPLETIDSHDWQEEYNQWLVDHQASDGHWAPSTRLGNHTSTALALLVLIPEITELGPIAVITAPDNWPPDTEWPMNGRKSSHADTSKQIVEWLWDFDASDGVDFDDPDATGKDVIHPGQSLDPGEMSRNVVVSLKVVDNSDSALTDIDQHTVSVNFENHEPVAECGGPYAGQIGELICFDGTGSWDPDEASGDYVAAYAWDLDGDEQFDDCFDSVCCYTWDAPYTGYVGLQVTDTHGASSGISQCYVTVWTSRMDAGLSDTDIHFDPPFAHAGDPLNICADIHAHADSDPIHDLVVRFYDGDPDVMVNQIGPDQVIDELIGGNVYRVCVGWVYPDEEEHEIFVVVDPDQDVEEFNELNNRASRTISPYEHCLEVWVEDVIANPGEDILVPIYIQDITGWGVMGFETELCWCDIPAGLLQYQGCLPGEVMTGSGWPDPVCNGCAPNCATVAAAGATPLDGGGVLFYLRFHVSANAKPCMCCDVRFDYVNLYDPEELLNVCWTDGEVCVEWCDVTGWVKYWKCCQDECGEWYLAEPLPGVNVDLYDCGGIVSSQNTDEEGRYGFTCLDPLSVGCYYCVTVETCDCLEECVTAYDASLILQHLVCLRDLHECPIPSATGQVYPQMVAADVNCSGKITAYDASLILQYVVGLIDLFPCMSQWQFFAWGGERCVYECPGEVDWVGVRRGDVSGCPECPDRLLLTSGEAVEVRLGTPAYFDDVTEIPVEVSGAHDIYSAEFELGYDSEHFSLLSVEATGLANDFVSAYGCNGGRLRLALAGHRPLAGDGELVMVRLARNTGAAAGRRPQLQLTSVGFNEGSPVAVVEGGRGDREIHAFALGPISPNPFVRGTDVHFHLPVASHVSIAIFDVKGRLVTSLVDASLPAGNHMVQWDGDDAWGARTARGVYFCRMETPAFRETKKVVLLQ